MLYLLIVVVIIAIFAVIFALQNTDLINVSFLFFEVQSSLALLLLITLAIGILLGLSVMTPKLFKSHRKISAKNKEIDALEDRLQKFYERKTEQVSPPPANQETKETPDK